MNKDIDERAKLYYNFYSQSTLHWVKVADEYYPGMPKPPEIPKIQNVAMQYKSPHHWAGPHMTAKAIAMEPDTKEMDEKGEPISYKFWYDVIFRWTSHFVHPSITALHSHLVRPGNEVFRVHRHKDLERIEFGRLSLHSLVATLGQMTTQFLRGMGEEYDGHLGTYALRLLQVPRPVIH